MVPASRGLLLSYKLNDGTQISHGHYKSSTEKGHQTISCWILINVPLNHSEESMVKTEQHCKYHSDKLDLVYHYHCLWVACDPYQGSGLQPAMNNHWSPCSRTRTCRINWCPTSPPQILAMLGPGSWASKWLSHKWRTAEQPEISINLPGFIAIGLTTWFF